MARKAPTRGSVHVARALNRAKALLRHIDVEVEVSSADLVRWFAAETPYPDLSLAAVLRRPLLVVHELVEIDVVKRMGLRLTARVILENMKAVDAAHLRAAEVEMDLAVALGKWAHLRYRLPHMRGWCEDPLVTPSLRSRYRRLYARAKGILAGAPKSKRFGSSSRASSGGHRVIRPVRSRGITPARGSRRGPSPRR